MDLLQDGPDLVVPVLQEGVQVPPQRPREQQGVLAQRRCVKFFFWLGPLWGILLCTGALLHAHYSFPLISGEFWMGKEGGEGAVRLCYLTARTGGVVWALKPS
jgi:hypothetical protein